MCGRSFFVRKQMEVAGKRSGKDIDFVPGARFMIK